VTSKNMETGNNDLLSTDSRAIIGLTREGANLENKINALSTVQARPDLMTQNGCKITLRFQTQKNPQVQVDVARMLIRSFLNRKGATNEKSTLPVQGIYEEPSIR